MSEQQNRRDDSISERVPDELIVRCPLKYESWNIYAGHGEGGKSVVNIDTAQKETRFPLESYVTVRAIVILNQLRNISPIPHWQHFRRRLRQITVLICIRFKTSLVVVLDDIAYY